MKIGFIGLGKMGTRIVEKLLTDGHEVIAWNRTSEVAEQFKIQNSEFRNKLILAESIQELISNLPAPKIIWMMLPAVIQPPPPSF
jgi:6-phosphogluconate dehydrogenase